MLNFLGGKEMRTGEWSFIFHVPAWFATGSVVLFRSTEFLKQLKT